MDVADDAVGSLDPRIQIELENLNNATDDINKLETELNEAHGAFGQLLSDSTKRLKEIADKLGSSSIEKARCYYEALEIAHQAQVKCQQQAQLFQRASEIHAAAKETVALAEARFMKHQHEWNFDQAWQDMLNHATIKVMDAENQKAECGREHHRRAMLFHDAEKRLLQLEEKHHRSIIKARPYFEIKAQCDQMLATQKERVECLQRAIKETKKNYAASLRALEKISNQIHQQRQDNDFVANGPREPGVGAELVSPEKSSNYEIEFNQLNNNRGNSVATNKLNKESRPQDFDNSCQSKADTEQLDRRSVDGSEATSSQWELELQVSMENLNNLSLENNVYDNDQDSIKPSDANLYVEKKMKLNNIPESNSNDSQSTEFPVYALNQLQKFTKNFQVLKKPLTTSSLMSHFQGLYTVKNDATDSIGLSKPRTVLKNSTSKSLDSSPINTNASCSKESELVEKLGGEEGITTYVPNKIFKFGLNNQKSQSNNDINLSWNLDISSVEKYQNSNNSNTNDILDDKTDKKITNSSCTKQSYALEEMSENDLISTKDINCLQYSTNSDVCSPSKKELLLNKRPKSNTLKIASNSASSSPIKVKYPSTLTNAKSLDKSITDSFNGYSDFNTLMNKTCSIKELPLLSLFEKTKSLADSKSKSFSMVNLDEKQNLTLNHSHLNHIQTVSIERLANARDNLFPKVPK